MIDGPGVQDDYRDRLREAAEQVFPGDIEVHDGKIRADDLLAELEAVELALDEGLDAGRISPEAYKSGLKVTTGLRAQIDDGE